MNNTKEQTTKGREAFIRIVGEQYYMETHKNGVFVFWGDCNQQFFTNHELSTFDAKETGWL